MLFVLFTDNYAVSVKEFFYSHKASIWIWHCYDRCLVHRLVLPLLAWKCCALLLMRADSMVLIEVLGFYLYKLMLLYWWAPDWFFFISLSGRIMYLNIVLGSRKFSKAESYRDCGCLLFLVFWNWIFWKLYGTAQGNIIFWIIGFQISLHFVCLSSSLFCFIS